MILFVVKIRTRSLAKTKAILETQVAKRTEQLRIQQQQITRINEELEERVEQRSRALSQVNENLRTEIRERRTAEENLKVSLKEKEILIKEIHHRVKNNLQIISSMLYLQSNIATDENTIAILHDSLNRIKSIALIHEKLYQSSDLANVNLPEYLEKLVNHLMNTYSRQVKVNFNFSSEKIILNLEKAIPCGLIINELLTNAYKYAFPESTISQYSVIDLSAEYIDENMLSISVKDNGVGFPEDKDFRESDSLGLRLVHSLILQLNGDISMNVNGGTQFQFSFPIN